MLYMTATKEKALARFSTRKPSSVTTVVFWVIMDKDCCKAKNEKVDRANMTAAGQIAHCVHDEEITEREWKEHARESLM
jgi:hypothetical protein